MHIMAAKYQHVPILQPRSIRIIYLEPASDLQSLLRCSLEVMSLDGVLHPVHQYTALSYAWDAQTPSSEIECDGGILLVTPNCEAAMRRLRSSTEMQILWIDSICIDQSANALEERSGQVALMNEIYRNASRVIVWVGDSDSAMEMALKTMTEIAGSQDRDDSENRRDRQQAIRERFQKVADTVTRASEDPIGPLFERSWFHRMWTIQEVTLSTADTIFLSCGEVIVPWINIILATDALMSGKYRWGRWKEAMSLQRSLTLYLMTKRYTGVKEILDDNPGDLHNDPLVFNILIQAREKLSGDPRDKVFALYGIFQELEVSIPAPDYTKALEDIYRESVVASINYDKNLYILYHAPSDNRRDGLASWVPDWSDFGWKDADPRYGILRDRFAACGSGEARWHFSEDQKNLIVTGKIVDTVIYRAKALPSADSMNVQVQNGVTDQDSFFRFNHIACTILKSWLEVSQWSEYPTGENTKDALQRTLVSDYPRCNADAKGGSFSNWYNFMTASELEVLELQLKQLQPSQIIPALPAARERILRAIKELIPEEKRTFIGLQAAAAIPFLSNIIQFSQKKCFFYTEKCYFGTAPDPLPTQVKAGDCIAVVGGLEMPLLLRPVEGGYRLLTHIYMHGIMHGEAWPEKEQDLEQIVLI